MVNFRSYENFQEADFIQDVHQAPLHIADIFDDVNDSYLAYQSLLMDIVDENALPPPPPPPPKQKYQKKDPPPFMNGELRRTSYKKRMLLHKYKKFKNIFTWEAYRQQRNHVTKLRKQSIRLYFL